MLVEGETLPLVSHKGGNIWWQWQDPQDGVNCKHWELSKAYTECLC